MHDTNESEPIGPSTSVREAVRRYPGIEEVFERHGLAGCGGPAGPPEPIGFFARAHNVDVRSLLAELNTFVAAGHGVVARPAAPPAPPQERSHYPLFLASSLAFALLIGFPLGMVTGLAVAFDWELGGRWLPLVQTHGHLQVMGWVGLFIMGIAYHVVPRFKATPLRFPRLVLPSLALVTASLLLRLATQPFADGAVAAPLLAVSGFLELAGAALFAAIVIATLRAGQTRETFDYYLVAGVAFFVAQAAFGSVLLLDAAADHSRVISTARQAPLLDMQFYGFMTLFVLGVSLRVLPPFLNLREPLRRAFLPALLLLSAGIVLRLVAGFLDGYGDGAPSDLAPAGMLMTSLALGAFVLALQIGLPSKPEEGPPGRGAYRWLIRTAYGWLLLAAALDAFYAWQLLAGGAGPDFLKEGAVRHALALGFITQMIFGVGTRVLPVFSGRLLFSDRLTVVVLIFINAAVATRVLPAVLETGSITSRWAHIGYSGALGMVALAAFAYNIIRTVSTPTEALLPAAGPRGPRPA